MALYCAQGKHKFEARYTKRLKNLKIEGYNMTPEEFNKISVYEVYVYDVCVRCGKIVRPKGDKL